MSGLPVKGWVRIWQDDSLVAEGKNRVVADGLKLLAERLDDGTTALPSLFKLGDSAAVTQEGMTALQGNEVGQLAATRVRRENILTWSGEFVRKWGCFRLMGMVEGCLQGFCHSSSSLSKTVLIFV